MSTRYENLFYLPPDLYAAGAPVIVRAGALLKDTQTGKLVAQLKFENLALKPIKAVTALLMLHDTAGKPLNESVEKHYLDLSAEHSDEFGSKTPILLDNALTRGFGVCVKEVIYADNTHWLGDEKEWPPLGCRLISLSEAFDDRELVKQYRIRFGEQSSYEPKEENGLWYCTCGVVHPSYEAACHQCGNQKEKLFSLDREELKAECDARLEQERLAAERQRAEEERQRIAVEKAAKKARKIAVIALAIIAVIIGTVLLTTKVIVPNVRYNAAVKLMDAAGTKDEYEEAIAAFEAMDGYKDSDEQIEACQTAIKDIAYDAAVSLMNKGKCEDAITAFKALDGYKDSEAQIASCVLLYIKNASVGDTVCFGAYEQDNNTSNGKEEIEWLVLAKENNKILVISDKAFDCKQFNTSHADVTWKSCSLRKWMNDTFLNSAFNADEQAVILDAKVTADKNPEYSTNPGNATTDKVFLLSITDTEKYLLSDSARQCKPTKYAAINGAYENSDNGNCRWWLRSPGQLEYTAASISHDGSVSYTGTIVNHDRGCVRPALWINIDP